MIIIVTTCLSYDIASTQEENTLYIIPDNNTSCPMPPCLTLEAYAINSTHNFNSTNFTLVFLSGIHSLETEIKLTNTSQLTLKGSEAMTSTIHLSFGHFTFIEADGLTIHSLAFRFSLRGEGNETAISFISCENVTLMNVSFDGGANTTIRALTSNDSTLEIKESEFLGIESLNGGAILGINSTIIFNGNNTFKLNHAKWNGGAIYLSSSDATFHDNTTFIDNTAGYQGGAIFAEEDSLITLNSSCNFEYNFVVSVYIEDVRLISGDGGGAIALVGSHMLINSATSFFNNIAPAGGAILAIQSTIVTAERTNFTQNSAFWDGAKAHNATDTEVTTLNNTTESDRELDSNSSYTRITWFGFGGAIWANTTNLTLQTTTLHNNSANIGGSMYGIYSHITFSNDTQIRYNTALYHGGALYLDNCKLSMTATTEFRSNSAQGSGSSLCVHDSSIQISDRVIVRDCFYIKKNSLKGTVYLNNTKTEFQGQIHFMNNSAHEGGAVYAFKSRIPLSNFSNFEGNKASLNGGGIYLEESQMTLLDTSVFRNNTAVIQGGCFYVSSRSKLILSDEVIFERNKAREGGVLALENGAFLTLSTPLNMITNQNAAENYGGVVYYMDIISAADCGIHAFDDWRPTPICFLELNTSLPFDVSNTNIHLKFFNNRAGKAGIILYGGNLRNCRMLVAGGELNNCGKIEGGQYADNPFRIIRGFSNASNSDNETSSIASAPIRVCFCDDGVPNCNKTMDVSIVPGKLFTMSAISVGQALGPVPSSITTDIDSNVEINASQRTQKTGKTCTDIQYRLFTAKQNRTLVLYPDGPCRDTGIARTKVRITLLPCPNGFTKSGSGTECVCEERLAQMNATCDIDDETIELSGQIWMKAVYKNDTYTGLILHRNCPYNYCKSGSVKMTLDNPNLQCDYNRTGLLCGSCIENYSLALGTFHCLKCSNHYLTLLIPFVLAGIILVIFLLALNLTVAKGTVNGLILYANIVQANKVVFIPQGETNILTVFIAWVNLDLGIEVCFFDGLTAYMHTWLQFAFPLYVWLLITVIIIASHKSRTISRWLGTNPVAVMATLLLMSYAKVLQTIICALSRTHLETPSGLEAVWSYDGNVAYLKSAKHIVLAAVAIFALVVLFLPYTCLLTFGWGLQNYSERRLFAWINKLKPFMDTIYGPYRKETRYWTGLLLVIRGVFFLTFAFNALSPYTTSTNLLAISSIFAGLSVLAWVNGKIYNKLYADLLESAYILNITIFAAATYHVQVVKGDQATLAHISIGIAFALFIGILLFHIYLRVQNTKTWKRLKIEQTVQDWQCKMNKMTSKNEKKETTEIEESMEMVAMNAEPTTTIVTLREPLLEYY